MKKIIKYILFYISLLFLLLLLQFITINIPNKYIKNNLINSLNDYEVDFHEPLIKTNNSLIKNGTLVDNRTDLLLLNILWNSNRNPNFKSLILMKYLEIGSPKDSLKISIEKDIEPNIEYSRYYHGGIIYLKLLLILFNVNKIRIINYIVLGLLTIYLLYLMYKKDKILSLITLISLISINYFVVPYCFEYYFIFLVSIIMSIISIKIYDKKESYYNYLFILSGLSACYFDFLTCETVSLMLPLFIKVYLDYKNNKFDYKKEIKFIIKSIIIWLLSYSITYLIKWIISLSILGIEYLDKLKYNLELRVTGFSKPIENIWNIIIVLLDMMLYLTPFNLIKSYLGIIITLIIITLIYIFLLNKQEKKYISILFIISLIGIGRMSLLYGHSFQHYFFDYRAYIGLVMVLLLVIVEGVRNGYNNINTMFKRRRNNRKSNR